MFVYRVKCFKNSKAIASNFQWNVGMSEMKWTEKVNVLKRIVREMVSPLLPILEIDVCGLVDATNIEFQTSNMEVKPNLFRAVTFQEKF